MVDDRERDARKLEEQLGIEDRNAGMSLPKLSSGPLGEGQQISSLRGTAPVGPPRRAMMSEEDAIRAGMQAIEKQQKPLGTYGESVMGKPPQKGPSTSLPESGFLSKGDSLLGGAGGPPTASFGDVEPLHRADPYATARMPDVNQPALPPARAMSEVPATPGAPARPGAGYNTRAAAMGPMTGQPDPLAVRDAAAGPMRGKPSLAQLQAQSANVADAAGGPDYLTPEEMQAAAGPGGFARGLAEQQAREDEIRRIRAGYDYASPRYD